MALARTFGGAVCGVEAQLVEVQADLSAGLPGLSFTGLADTSVVESRDRIRAAVVNSGIDWPNRRITVALLPADVRKVGARFDLAMAMAVLGAAGEVPGDAVSPVLWIAELGLDGALRPVHGVLPVVVAALRSGVRKVVVAAENSREAGLVTGVDVRFGERLSDVTGWLRCEGPALERADGSGPEPAARPRVIVDLGDVAGQSVAKRALEVAAAGGHHLCMLGPPGAGKTMLANRLPDLLPPLDDDAALEVSAVHSVAGLLGESRGLIRRPPFEAPHHSASTAALVGGGSHLARPGAVSLAHHGVLFLDEAAEFAPSALDALRQPLESGEVILHRRGGAVRYPARFQCVLAANPCPCGRSADCECAPHVRRRYRQRLSGPLLDRVDVRVTVEPVPRVDLLRPTATESSETVARRVAQARAAAAARWSGEGWRSNAAVPGPRLRDVPWALPANVIDAADQSLERGLLTARGLDRVLRLAWTLADLSGRVSPAADDIAEALYFRTGDAGMWAA